MREEIKKLKKKVSNEFLEKIEIYKKNSGLSYKEIADLVGINIYYFNNLRCRMKKEEIIPSDKILKKFEKIGIV